MTMGALEAVEGVRSEDRVQGPKLSVFLVTRNEEAHLDQVLASVAGADEIVMVDSGSTDATVAIARRHGARVMERPWPGYARQKAFAMEQCTHDWVLNLDGDEVLPPGGLDRIRERIGRGDVDGLYLPHDDLFMGAPLPGQHLHRGCRVYRRSRASWDPARHVHEHVDVAGPTEDLDVVLLHYGHDRAPAYMEKLARYAELKARQRVEQGRGFSNLRLVFGFPLVFLKHWLVGRMFLGGRRGFIKAWMNASYAFLTEAYLYESAFRSGPLRGNTDPFGEDRG
jgi:glycosyltransferase involved in cell wall biosynthesis